MMERGCCVTGHRDLPKEGMEEIRAALEQEIGQAIRDGYTDFLCGFARGADLLFAEVAAERIAGRPDLRLIAVIPDRGRLESLQRHPDSRMLLEACAEVIVVSEGHHPGVYALRNRYLVEHSRRLIALYDGRPTGGTAATLRLAKSMGLEIHLIPLPGREG